METIPKKKKRLIIEVNQEFHSEIKQYAARRNITMRTWIVRAIVEQLKKEKQYEQ